MTNQYLRLWHLSIVEKGIQDNLVNLGLCPRFKRSMIISFRLFAKLTDELGKVKVGLERWFALESNQSRRSHMSAKVRDEVII